MTPTADGEACNECESCVASSTSSGRIISMNLMQPPTIRWTISVNWWSRCVSRHRLVSIRFISSTRCTCSGFRIQRIPENIGRTSRHAIFILATTEKHKRFFRLSLSRCQIYDFNRISVEDTVNHLSYVAAKKIFGRAEALNVIASESGWRYA